MRTRHTRRPTSFRLRDSVQRAIRKDAARLGLRTSQYVEYLVEGRIVPARLDNGRAALRNAESSTEVARQLVCLARTLARIIGHPRHGEMPDAPIGDAVKRIYRLLPLFVGEDRVLPF